MRFIKSFVKYQPITLFLLLLIPFVAEAQDVTVDREKLFRDIRILSSDTFEGRRTGTVGNRLAQVFITDRYQELGLKTVGGSYYHNFDFDNSGDTTETGEASNLIGYIEGSMYPDEYIVVSAHFDHLGIQGGEIYNGADDNASGTSGLMAAAAWFHENPPENSIIFVAFDAEEQGLAGARHFVENPPVPLSQIVLAINMDMISTNAENELYAVGTYHYDFLRELIEESVNDSPVNVLFGHDSPDLEPGNDWTFASDHGPFHQRGVPFVYFGVEDHPYYHQPSDTFDTINKDFFYNSVTTIINFIQDIDGKLEDIRQASGR